MRRAFIVMDMQQGFVDSLLGESESEEILDELLHSVNTRIKSALNERNILIYAANEAPDSALYNLFFKDLPIKGSKDSRIANELLIGSDIVVSHVFSNAFLFTKLHRILKNSNVNEVFIVGREATKSCRKTAMSSVKHGYRTFIVRSALFSSKPLSDVEACDIKMTEAGVHFIGAQSDMVFGFPNE